MIHNKLKILLSVFLLLNLNQLWAAPLQPVDLRILVDISGEMRTSFPQQQHLDALGLLVQRLPEGSRAGVWTYGKYVNHLVKQGPVTEFWRRNASDQIAKIRSVATKRNLASVLEKAGYDAAKQETGYHRVILLLSGGGIYVSDSDQENASSRLKVLTRILPKLREAGFTIHTLASSNADLGLLRTLAKETNGFAFTLDNGIDIYQAIISLAQWLSPGQGVEVVEQRFAIDAKVEEFTAVLTHSMHDELTIQAPSGLLITEADRAEEIHWTQGERYSLVRVIDPELGQWRILEEVGKDSQVYVKSPVELTVKQLEDNYVAGQNINVRVALIDSGDGVDFGEPRVTIELQGDESFSYELKQDPHASNEYVGQFNGFHSAGAYTLKARAESLEYTRVTSQPFQVYDLLSIDVTTQQGAQAMDYLLTMRPTDSDLDLNNSTIIATITDASGEWTVRTVNLNEAGVWELLIEDDGQSSQYTVDLDFKGTTASGRKIHYQPKPLLIEATREVAPVEVIAAPVTEEEPADLKVEAPEASTEAAGQGKPRLLILIAGICFVLSSALILFYYLKRSARKQAGNTAEEEMKEDLPPAATAEHDDAAPTVLETATDLQPEPVAMQEPPDTEEQPEETEPVSEVDEIEIEEEESDELEVEISFDEPDEDSAPDDQMLTEENPPEPAQSDTPQFEGSSEEQEADIEQDQDLAEETELADEWSQLDAESNIPSDLEEGSADKIDIEFDFDDEEDKESPQ